VSASKDDSMPEWATGLVVAGAALVTGLISSLVTSWLAGREKANEDLREKRVDAYPQIWRLTGVVSIWPRTGATWGDLEELHLRLRRWYYTTGGLYLSEHARERYGDVQDVIAAHLRQRGGTGEPLPDSPVYDDVQTTCSAFRTSLTEDLETRRSRSLLRTIGTGRFHRRKAREASRRLQRIGAPKADRVLRCPVDWPPEAVA
jgi:hypothetical protein